MIAIMSQHFLLSAQARDLSLTKVACMTDEEAWDTFVRLRFGEDGTQFCPCCGCINNHFFIKTRKQWRCKDCGHTFSVTSGTIFSNHKLPVKVLLLAVALFVHSAKGMSALQLSRNLDVQYKTAYVLFQKLRDALWRTRDTSPLQGEVEMDGGYFHSYVRPKNKKRDRVDRRLRHNLNPMKRSILVMRERGEAGEGSRRTIIEVIKKENEKDILALTKKYVHPGVTIFADEHPGYTGLASRHPVRQVNHQEEYSADDGTNENQAESYFSRMRRLMIGQIHKCNPKYLIFYGQEIAWREDTRRQSCSSLFEDLMKRCLSIRPSKMWGNYWQGNHLQGDTLFISG